MYTLKKFGTTTLPDARPNQLQGTGKIGNDDTFPLPGGGVMSALGSGQAATQGAAISCTGAITTHDQAAAALETQWRALRALIGKRAKLYRQWDDSGLWEWVYARCEDVRANRTAQNLNYLDIELVFTQHSAVWNGHNHGWGWYLDAGEYLDSGLFLDESTDYLFYSGGDGVLKSCTVNNGGNAPVHNCIIRVQPKDGDTITAVLIQRKISTTVYEHLTVTRTLHNLDVLAIDCGARTVVDTSNNAYNDFALGASHQTDDWLKLEPGDNTIEVTLTGGTAATEISFSFCDGQA